MNTERKVYLAAQERAGALTNAEFDEWWAAEHRDAWRRALIALPLILALLAAAAGLVVAAWPWLVWALVVAAGVLLGGVVLGSLARA